MYTVSPKLFPNDNRDLGTFEVKSGRLVVSDPCYSRDTWCQGVLENVKNGTWRAFVLKGETDFGWGNRCWELIAMHKDHCSVVPFDFMDMTIKADFEVGVDSGQAGIFDEAEFRGGEDEYGEGGWYDLACSKTLDTENHAGVMPGGAVSSSGFGDGGYECYVTKHKKEIVGVKIVFITPDYFSNSDESDEPEFDDGSEKN